MSERYSRLFTLPENLYAAGSPVVIAAGTLLKDNQTGRIVAQLKMRSISPKRIIGIKVSLSLFDNAGNSIGTPVDFDYLDLNASRDAQFGQKVPVPIAESKARSYAASITEVVFADKTTWAAPTTQWDSLPRQNTLDAALGNTELIKQYKIAVGSNFSFYPLAEKDLWYCTCGALNHEGEDCHVCSRTLFELQTIDLDQLAKDRDARLAQEAAAAEAKAAAEKAAVEAAKKKTAKILKIAIPVVCTVIALVVLLNAVIIPNSKYNKAVSLMDAGQYEEAIAAFEALDGYKDSAEQIAHCENAIVDAEFSKAEELLAAGDYDSAMAIYESLANAEGMKLAENAKLEAAYQAAEALAKNDKIVEAAIAFGKLGDYGDARERSYVLWSVVADWESVAMGSEYTLGLKNDGTVVATGENDYGQCDVGNWRNIIDIAAGGRHSVGLKSDGTVVAVGSNEDIYDKYVRGQCEVSAWTDIVDVCAGSYHTVGLKSDGTVVAVGSNYEATDYDTYCGQCDVTGWSDIIAISAGVNHTVGLKSDGTVVAVGSNKNGQCDVSSWSGIVAISAGNFHTVGLKSDGTVVAVGWNEWNACNVSGWRNITAIDAGYCLTVGVCEDGTVISVGKVDNKLTSMTDWNDIIDVYAGSFNAIGLTEDGTLIATGRNNKGEMNVSDWTNIKLPN